MFIAVHIFVMLELSAPCVSVFGTHSSYFLTTVRVGMVLATTDIAIML